MRHEDTNLRAKVSLDRDTNRCHPQLALPEHQHPLRYHRRGKGRQIWRWADCRSEACAPTPLWSRVEHMKMASASGAAERPLDQAWKPSQTKRLRGAGITHKGRRMLTDVQVKAIISYWWDTELSSTEIAKRLRVKPSLVLSVVSYSGYLEYPKPCPWPAHRPMFATVMRRMQGLDPWNKTKQRGAHPATNSAQPMPVADAPAELPPPWLRGAAADPAFRHARAVKAGKASAAKRKRAGGQAKGGQEAKVGDARDIALHAALRELDGMRERLERVEARPQPRSWWRRLLGLA